MKQLYIFLFLIIVSVNVFACCAERNYRLFPIGEIKNSPVLIEVDLFRQCKNIKGMPGIGSENEFWIKGTVKLVTIINDSVVLIENIDSVDLRECICTYENQYEKSELEFLLEKWYSKAFKKAKSKKGFKEAKPVEINFNDTLNISVARSDTSIGVTYKNYARMDISFEDMISCTPETVIEERKYETENLEITVVRLSCQHIDDTVLKSIEMRFEKLETAFWKDKAVWHGFKRDYVFIKPKQP